MFFLSLLILLTSITSQYINRHSALLQDTMTEKNMLDKARREQICLQMLRNITRKDYVILKRHAKDRKS